MLLMSLACDAIALGSNQVEVEVEVEDGKWSTQQMYDFGFSRRFVLVRV